MHKEGNKLCIIYMLIYGCYHGLESVLITFTVLIIKQHPVNISLLKKLSALKRHRRSCCLRIEIKHLYP